MCMYILCTHIFYSKKAVHSVDLLVLYSHVLLLMKQCIRNSINSRSLI